MHILSIPTEIFDEIFYHLGLQNLLECVLVCKSWNVPALQLLYNNLNLEAYHIYLAKQQLKMNANERNGYFKHGPFVKKLVIMRDGKKNLEQRHPKGFEVDSIQDTDCELDKNDFILLLEYLPNIQLLDICNSAHVTKYLQYLLDTESNKCLNQIQAIPYAMHFFQSFHSNGSVNVYYLVCYKYRASIISLEVDYEDMTIEVGSQGDKILTFLSHFTSLIHLTLNNYCDYDYLTTFDIQKACPRLISLKYKSCSDIPDGIVNNILDDPANCNLKSNLKILELGVPTVPVNYAKYITDYVFTQLDTLKLSMDEINLYEWIDDIGMDNALKLANRLGTVKNASIAWMFTKEYGRELISNESRMTTFFKLLNAFKGDKKTFCRAVYSDSFGINDSMLYNLKDGLHFNYRLVGYHDYYIENEEQDDYSPENEEQDDYYPENEEQDDYYLENEEDSEQDDYMIDQEHRSPRVLEILLPDIAISIIGPEVVNYFDISIYSNNPELAFKFLKYALIHCPNLERFDFQFTRCRPYQQIRISTDIGEYKARENHDILLKSTQENMKVVKTSDFFPSRKLLNLISGYLPNIELFAFGGYDYYHPTTPKMPEINFTAFKNLKTIYFIIQVISGYGADHAFIHFKYSDGDEVLYCQNKTDDLVLNLVTLEFLQECNNNENLDSRSIIIKCNKDVKFVVCWNIHSIIAEFDNGILLDNINTNSNLLHEVFSK